MSIFLVDAFTTQRFKGNRAGVVLDPEGYSRETKQQIAEELNASETVFASLVGPDLYSTEYFTPTTEVDFCGHATIALFHTLAKLGKIGNTRATVQTKAGIFAVEVDKDTCDDIIVTMTQTMSQFAAPPCTIAQAAQALCFPEEALDPGFPLGLAKTGNWHLMIGLKNRNYLDQIEYDPARLSEILHRADAVTAHVFCAGDADSFHVRNFGPTVGIPEDPATGSAAGAFAAYLAHEGLIADGDHKIKIVQGEKMGRISHISLSLSCSNRTLNRVEIKGSAIISFQLTHGTELDDRTGHLYTSSESVLSRL